MRYSEVGICGVNTVKLRVLTKAEKQMLLQKIKHGIPAKKKRTREKMISNNLRLILSVIQRLTNRGENLDGLFQVGCIGLMKAIDSFNLGLDARFSTYGVPMIINEIRRYLRDNNNVRVSRSMCNTTYKAIQMEERITTGNGKELTVSEIAKAPSLQREEVVLALETTIKPVSLYEPVSSNGNNTIYMMDQIGDENDDSNWLNEIALKEATNDLSDREKWILFTRFFQGKTQVEITGGTGINQTQAPRLEKGALDKIKRET